uniref:hypothetical protein n=1 Tax=Xanthomonas oryzae TaxID=347 RepID=UPI003DA0CFE2
MSSLGDQALQLTVRQGWTITPVTWRGNAGLAIAAGALSNQGGAIAAAGTTDATVTVAGRLDNSGGSISGKRPVSRGCRHLDQPAWQRPGCQWRAAASMPPACWTTVPGAPGSGGEFAVQAGTLDNRGGAIEHGGNGTLAVSADTLQGAGGSLLSLGSLQLARRRARSRDRQHDPGRPHRHRGRQPAHRRWSSQCDRQRPAAGAPERHARQSRRQHRQQWRLDLQAATLLNSDGTLSGAGSADGRITVRAIGQHPWPHRRNGATLQIAADQ